MNFIRAAGAVEKSMIFSNGFVAGATFTAVYTLVWCVRVSYMEVILFFSYFIALIMSPFVTSITY